MKKLVVIGGGFAGSIIAKELQGNFDVTLIDTKDFFEFTPSILRVLVEPEHVKKIQVLHTHYLDDSKIIKGEVSRIFDDYVFVNKEKIPFDFLVLASGSKYGFPFKDGFVKTSRSNDLRNHHGEIEKSDRILIVGGGLVGVELAGEILWKYPEKEVIIVHSRNQLIQRSNKKAKEYARKYLEKRGVRLIFGEKVVGSRKGVFFTDKKRDIKADMAFLCVGVNPNSGFVKESFKKSVDEKGFVKVNGFLQMEGHENIFVAGDVSSFPEEKTAQNAHNHAKRVIKNILRKNKGRELLRYKPKERAMVLSLGKYNGIFTYKKFTITGIVPGIMKSMIEKMEMGKHV